MHNIDGISRDQHSKLADPLKIQDGGWLGYPQGNNSSCHLVPCLWSTNLFTIPLVNMAFFNRRRSESNRSTVINSVPSHDHGRQGSTTSVMRLLITALHIALTCRKAS